MNKFPYSNGHIMVCPYRHVMALAQLETDETHEIMDLMQRCTLVLQEHFHCEGINIGREPVSGNICTSISCRAGTGIPPSWP